MFSTNLKKNKFSSNYDITHTISVATAYEIKNLKLSAGLNWRTGKPTTRPISGDEIVNNKINYSASNSSNLNAFMRVDASAIYDFTLSKKIKAQAGLSVLNLLDQKNIINSYYIVNDDNLPQEIKEYSLGITPNFAFRVFF